jgi:rod shape-determining protein MreD
MTRLLLRAFNGPAIILIALMGIAIQTSFFSFWILPFLRPDFVLLIVIWCALRRDFTEGGILTLILANVSEIHTSAPSGMFMTSYMLVYFLVRSAARILVIPDLSSFLLITLWVSVFAKVCNISLLYLLGAQTLQIKQTIIYIFPTAVVNAILGKWLFQWLEKFDWFTFKDARADRSLSSLDDELQLESKEI